MSCGTTSVRVTDENGNMDEQPTTDVTGNALNDVLTDSGSPFFNSIPENLFDNETFDEQLTQGIVTKVNNPGATQDALKSLIEDETGGIVFGEYIEIVSERETETVTLTDPTTGASIEVERITYIVFELSGGDPEKRIKLNIGPWT